LGRPRYYGRPRPPRAHGAAPRVVDNLGVQGCLGFTGSPRVLSAAAPGSACGLLAGRALRREPARGGPQRAPHARARAKFAQCPAWLPPACRRPAGRCNKLPAREKPATTGGSVPRMQRPGPTWMRCGGERQLAAALARVSGVTRGRSAATTSAPASASAMATTPAPGAPARAQVRRSQTEGGSHDHLCRGLAVHRRVVPPLVAPLSGSRETRAFGLQSQHTALLCSRMARGPSMQGPGAQSDSRRSAAPLLL